ncbi:hypothetical protein [Actinokineospora diospyrosa]|uniref:hypothetical protein n=1 Tax=Actinokineospora diospyrosa TaxID=103728 RepID=UPI0020A4B912|nr:hypothetical protein [Actinokineospora diospyrosa]
MPISATRRAGSRAHRGSNYPGTFALGAVDRGYLDASAAPGTMVLKTRGAGLANSVAAAELLSGRLSGGAPRDWW